MDANFFLEWASIIVVWGITVALLILDRESLLSKKVLQFLVLGFVIYLVAIAALRTGIQWKMWSGNEVSKKLLGAFNKDNAGYFTYYAYAHFFLPAIVSISAAFVLGAILKLLNAISKSRWVSSEEVWFGIVVSLLAGWPGILLLVPFVFVGMAAILLLASVFRPLGGFKKLSITPVLYVMLIVILIFGKKLADFLQLGVLKV